jgi:hypothetical protein
MGILSEISNSNFQPSKQSDVMTDAIKDWLPITKRNRMALGIAGLALLMFVTWNFLPFYDRDYTTDTYPPKPTYQGLVAIQVWPQMVDPDNYIMVFKSPDVDGFLSVAASVALLMNGLIVLTLVPLWKILHASIYLRLPIALVNLLGGAVVLKYSIESLIKEYNHAPFQNLTLFLIALTMLMVSLSMLIFKNELELRHELEVKKMMWGGD